MPEGRRSTRLSMAVFVLGAAAVAPAASVASEVQTTAQTRTATSLSPTAVRERLLNLRKQLVGDSKYEPARQGLADLAVRLAQEIGRLDLQGSSEEAEQWAELLKTRLDDTGWRIGHMAKKGDARALAALGVMYERGILFKANTSTACGYYARAAEFGDPLGRGKQVACGVPETQAAAAQRQSASPVQHRAAQPDDAVGSLLRDLLLAIEHAEATAKSAVVVQLSDLVAVQARTELWTLERDVAGGDARAELALATAYRRGLGVAVDHDEACRLYQRANRLESIYADYRVALCVARSDRGESLRLLRRAAQGNHAGAQELLARSCLEEGDVTCALRWLCRAARQGRAGAQSLLAWVYANGEGVERDAKRAFFFYVLAATAGELSAQNNLGEMFESGSMGTRDLLSAALWYKRAAGAGLAQAQLNLGRLYAQGHGLPKDTERAGYWFEQAAGQGNQDAREMLQWLANQEDGG